ncbi:MAG: amidohydrolase family protein [Pseudomonadota bacterium]
MKRSLFVGLVMMLLCLPGWAQADDRFDVVIKNGRVMDPETGLDGVRYLGIRDGTIDAISTVELRGATVIDATGLVVSPGFIDLHAHGQTAKANEFQAMDGVTTALELEGGVADVELFFADRDGKAIVNYGASVAHARVRTLAMPELAERYSEALAAVVAATDEDRRDAEGQFARSVVAGLYVNVQPEDYPALMSAMDEQLEHGGLGIGVPHQYYPGASYDEILRVFEFAADRDVPIFTHVRDMGVAAVQEVIANAAITGASLHIVHLNSSSLGDYRTNLDLVRGAQKRGLDVTTEAYPYTAASTSIESAIFNPGWQEKLGITYADIQWQDSGERLTEETFKAYREQGGIVIIHMMKPEWIRALVADPMVMIASDGMPYAPGAHPRSAGTYSRFLGKYVRDEGVIDLMPALRKITLMPALRMQGVAPSMRQKGRIQVGADADITMFDPEYIIDTATFEEDLSFSKGVEYVMVNGTLVVSGGELVAGARPGRPVVGVRQ